MSVLKRFFISEEAVYLVLPFARQKLPVVERKKNFGFFFLGFSLV